MVLWSTFQSTLAAISLASVANAITIYTLKPGATPTIWLSPDGQYTGLPAFDPIQHAAPPIPVPPAPTAVSLALQSGDNIPGLSKQMRSDFVGISLEMSVADRIIGRNGTFLDPKFLNHIQNLRARSGTVSIRVGGNSQEKSTLVPALFPNVGATINKTEDLTKPAGTTEPPILTYSEDLLYAMSNISSLVDVGWYLGLPFLNEGAITNVATRSSEILGSYLRGLQMANEPDLYVSHARKTAPYGIPEYMADWRRVRDANVPTRTDLIAPNVCCGFKIDDILAQGFLTQFASSLKMVAVQHYLDNACQSNLAKPSPEAFFASILSHTAVINFMLPYANAASVVNAAGKEFVLFETNTASCGGFPGASDSFGAGLYLLDLSLQAAFRGISQVLFHNGGVGQYYNLFTPPQTNQSNFREWTTGSPYYSALIMAEAMSKPGSQVVDLQMNGGNVYTPGYAIYHSGVPNKLALFNYVTDPTGANDLNVAVSIGGGATGQGVTTPSQISVRYFSPSAGSTGDKFNLTWAGQTMGDQFTSDGRLRGTPVTDTIQCTGGICNVPVKAPQFALVFLTTDGVTIDPVEVAQTFEMTVATKIDANLIVPPGVLRTSDGRGGEQELFNIGGTSRGSIKNGSARVEVGLGILFVVGVMSGLMVIMTSMRRL